VLGDADRHDEHEDRRDRREAREVRDGVLHPPRHAGRGEQALDGQHLVAAGDGDRGALQREQGRGHTDDREQAQEEVHRVRQLVAGALDAGEHAVAPA
jgi:hypothetical protein